MGDLTDWKPEGAAAKLAFIQAKMSAVDKTGKHQQGFKYIQEHKLIEMLRGELRALHCAVIVEPAETVDVREAAVFNKPGFLVTLTGRIRFIDTDVPVDSPDREVSARVCGQGTDPGDKAAGKAQTYLTKYALQKLFLIPTEQIDDADASAPEPPVQQRSRGPRKPAARRAGLLEFTRQAIRDLEPTTLPDEEWQKLLEASDTTEAKKGLLEALNETLSNLGGDPVELRRRFEAAA